MLAAVLLIVPSFLDPATVASLEQRLPSFSRRGAIVLGLDLQGGAHLLMEVDKPSLVKSQVEQLRDDVRAKLREAKIPLSGGVAVQPRGVIVRIADPAERAKALDLLQSLNQRIGGTISGATDRLLDIDDTGDGGIRLTLTDAAINDKVRRAVAQSIEVLNRRLNASGTKETNVQQQGADRVLIEVPGLQDTTKLKQLVGTTAKLEFRLVADAGDPPSDVETLKQQQGGEIQVEKRVMVAGRGSDRRAAGLRFSAPASPTSISSFNLRGGQRFGQVTSDNVGRPFAIVLDNIVISAPRILGPITGGSRPDHRQFHRRTGRPARRAAALRRAAGQAHHRRGAHGRARPRPGFDRRRQTRRAGRRPAGDRLYAGDLWDFRRVRRSRARRAHPVHFRLDGAARRDADACRASPASCSPSAWRSIPTC